MKRKISLKLETIKGKKVPVSGFKISTVPSSRLDLGVLFIVVHKYGKVFFAVVFVSYINHNY